MTHMESCSNQRMMNKSKYILYSKFFKVATLYYDDSFPISFTWNAFPSLCGPTHPKPGHRMQQSIALLLGQLALTQPGGVFAHCQVEKQMIVPLSPNQMGWRIAAMLIKFVFNSK